MNYNGPGNSGELSEQLIQQWQIELSKMFDSEILHTKQGIVPSQNKVWLFNPITSGTANTIEADIKWNAFPRRLLVHLGSETAAWRQADTSREEHDEYCEWEIVRDPQNQSIKRVTFTTEAPEFYDFLFRHNPTQLLALYHEYVSSEVTLESLTLDGQYDPRNPWNKPERHGKRGTLMHMCHVPNTFGAAVNLSAQATWPSIDEQGRLITDEQGLIDCRRYGDRERHSDPHIGAQINALVRAGNEISFAGPVGLYIDSVDLSGFETPDGSEAEAWMRVTRGDSQHMIRVVFEAPAGSNFTLSDVKVDGNKIHFGGQIAEKLTIRIRGIARSADERAPTISCSGLVAKSIDGLSPKGLIGTSR